MTPENVNAVIDTVKGTVLPEEKIAMFNKACAIDPHDTVVIEDYTFKVTSIAANAFKGDSDIKKLTIGANVTTIGKNAFFKCTSCPFSSSVPLILLP